MQHCLQSMPKKMESIRRDANSRINTSLKLEGFGVRKIEIQSLYFWSTAVIQIYSTLELLTLIAQTRYILFEVLEIIAIL